MSEPSVIHDIGYQRYQGPRLGRSAVFGALYVQALRASFGFGRSFKAKIFPWLVGGIVLLVAVIDAGLRAQANIRIMDYYQFDDVMSRLVIFFAAIIAPALVSRDLRSNVLPLYFSRPLRASDYVLAKVAALVTAIWLLLGVPQLIMFLGAAFTTKTGFSGVWKEAGYLIPGWGYSLLWAIMFASIGLLIASLTGKQAFAAGGIVAFFLITAAITGALFSLGDTMQHLAGLFSPITMLLGVQLWLRIHPPQNAGIDIGRYGALYGIEVACLIAAALLLLLARYRKVASL